MINSFKKWFALGCFFAGSVVLGAFGGYWLFQWRCHKVSAMQERLWEHMAMQREALAYFRLMQALESGKTNDLEGFRNRTAVTFKRYLDDVAQVQERYGSEWAPLDKEFHSRVHEFLKKQPSSRTN